MSRKSFTITFSLVIFGLISLVERADCDNSTNECTDRFVPISRREESFRIQNDICKNVPCLTMCLNGKLNPPESKVIDYKRALKIYQSDYKNGFKLSKKSGDDFVIVRNEKFDTTCADFYWKYEYDLPDTAFYILEDGRLVLDNFNRFVRFNELEMKDYCFEILEQLQGNSSVSHILFTVYFGETEPPYESEFYESSKYIVLSLSSFCLFLLLVIYWLMKEQRKKLQILVQMCYAGTFMVSFIGKIVQFIINDHFPDYCIYITFALYYGFLSSFLWMNILSFDMWRAVCHGQDGWEQKKGRRRFKIKFTLYCCYAWGLPIIPTSIAGVLQSLDLRHKPYIVKPFFESCFELLGGSRELVIYLHVPLCILLLCNVFFFTMTAYHIYKIKTTLIKQTKDKKMKEKLKQKSTERLFLYLKIFLAMGIPWVMEMLDQELPNWLYELGSIFNGLSGVIIFFIFVFKTDKLKRLYQKFLKEREEKSSTNTTSETIRKI